MDNDVLWLDENRVVGLGELVEISGLTREELIELAQGGAIPVHEVHGTQYTFSARVIGVARTACRLRDELELDIAGLAVALRLLERVRGLEEEIARLRALLPRS
jgi:chaperone modulatory protein CbpM